MDRCPWTRLIKFHQRRLTERPRSETPSEGAQITVEIGGKLKRAVLYVLCQLLMHMPPFLVGYGA